MKHTLTGVTKEDSQFGRVLKVQAKGEDGTVIPRATIYETQKDGTKFPNFDDITEGSVVDVNPWTNPKGYVSLFPQKDVPKPAGNRGAMMEKTMEKKATMIATAQESKAEGIKISSTIRMATDIVISMNKEGKMTPDAIRAGIQEWRRWLWFQWDTVTEYPPFESKVAGTNIPYPDSINPEDIPF